MSIVPYLVYDSEGRILRSGYCRGELVDLQAGEGESALRERADDARHKVVGGKLAAKTQQEIELDQSLDPAASIEQRSASPSDAQWQDLEARLVNLEQRLLALEKGRGPTLSV